MPAATWRYDPSTSRVHRGISYVMIGSLGGVGLLQFALVGWLLVRRMPTDSPWTPLVVVLAGIAVLVGTLRYRRRIGDAATSVWPFRRYESRWLLLASVASAIVLHAVATIAFEAALALFAAVFALSGILEGIGTSEGAIDPEEGILVVNGRTATLSDIETLRTVAVGPAVVIRPVPADDADGRVPAFFVVDPSTADQIRAAIGS